MGLCDLKSDENEICSEVPELLDLPSNLHLSKAWAAAYGALRERSACMTGDTDGPSST